MDIEEILFVAAGIVALWLPAIEALMKRRSTFYRIKAIGFSALASIALFVVVNAITDTMST